MIYDPKIGGLIVIQPSLTFLLNYNVSNGSSPPVNSSITWAFVNDSWMNLTGQIGSQPPGSAFFYDNLGYDPASGCAVGLFAPPNGLFALNGSMALNHTTVVQTWQLCNGNWTEVGGNSSDPMGYINPYTSGHLVYDPQFGGEFFWGGSYNSWVYSNRTWTKVHWTGSAPPTKMDPLSDAPASLAVVYDPAESYLLLLGGTQFYYLPWTAHMAWGFGLLPPFLNLTATPDPAEVTAPLTLTAGLAGGLPPVSFLYSGLPPGCVSSDTAILQCHPTQPGNYTIHLSVSDHLNRSALASTRIHVLPAASLRLLASSTATDVGVPVLLHLSATGGLPPFSYGYSGLPPGCASSDSPNLTCTPTSPGIFSVLGAVEDSESAISTVQINLTVHPDPSITSLRLSRSTLDVGQLVSLSVLRSGGTGVGSWNYSGLPPNCPSVNASRLSCVPSAPGAYTVGVRFTDALGVIAERTITWSVWPRLSVTLTDSANPSRVPIGLPNRVTAEVQGGLSPYQIHFEGLPGEVGDGPNLTWTPISPTPYVVRCQITDANGASVVAQLNLSAVRLAPPSSFPTLVVVGAGATAVILIAAGVLLLRRRGKSGR